MKGSMAEGRRQTRCSGNALLAYNRPGANCDGQALACMGNEGGGRRPWEQDGPIASNPGLQISHSTTRARCPINQGGYMNEYRLPRKALAIMTYVLTSACFLNAQTPAPTVPVQMTVTVDVVGEGKRMPEVSRDDVRVNQGRESRSVTDWVAACDDRAGLDLFILIDDASDTSLGGQLADLRAFVNSQPSTTAVGIGYMRNAVVQIAQNFTTDHAAAAKAL